MEKSKSKLELMEMDDEDRGMYFYEKACSELDIELDSAMQGGEGTVFIRKNGEDAGTFDFSTGEEYVWSCDLKGFLNYVQSHIKLAKGENDG